MQLKKGKSPDLDVFQHCHLDLKINRHGPQTSIRPIAKSNLHITVHLISYVWMSMTHFVYAYTQNDYFVVLLPWLDTWSLKWEGIGL